MKNLLFIALILLGFVACKKEETAKPDNGIIEANSSYAYYTNTGYFSEYMSSSKKWNSSSGELFIGKYINLNGGGCYAKTGDTLKVAAKSDYPNGIMYIIYKKDTVARAPITAQWDTLSYVVK